MTGRDILVELAVRPSLYPRLLKYLGVIWVASDGRAVKAATLLRNLRRAHRALNPSELMKFREVSLTEMAAETETKGGETDAT